MESTRFLLECWISVSITMNSSHSFVLQRQAKDPILALLLKIGCLTVSSFKSNGEFKILRLQYEKYVQFYIHKFYLEKPRGAKNERGAKRHFHVIVSRGYCSW